jgi:hypothetical protein
VEQDLETWNWDKKMDKAAIIEVLKKKFALDPQTARVLVAGLGRTGISSAHYLRDLGIKFAIIDSRAKPPLMEIFSRQMPDAAVFTGGFDEAAFKVATHLIVSPDMSHNEKAIIKATANGARIVSDIDLLACSVGVPVVANGSSGKRTVTTHQEEICYTWQPWLMAFGLQRAERVILGGIKKSLWTADKLRANTDAQVLRAWFHLL